MFCLDCYCRENGITPDRRREMKDDWRAWDLSRRTATRSREDWRRNEFVSRHMGHVLVADEIKAGLDKKTTDPVEIVFSCHGVMLLAAA